MILSGFRAALDLDTYPLSNIIRPCRAERAKPGRGKPVLIKKKTRCACAPRVNNFFVGVATIKMLMSWYNNHIGL